MASPQSSSSSNATAMTNPPVALHGPVLPTALSVTAVVVPSILAPLAILAVSLRFYAQRHSKHGISADDYAFFGALVFTVGISVLCIYGALMAGLGWPVDDLTQSIIIAYWKELFAGLALWGSSLSLIRAGLLLFYRRIFSGKAAHIAIYVLLVVNACWFLSLIIGMFAKYRWIPNAKNIQGYPNWLIVYAVIDVAQDLATATIPLFVIRTLNMKLKRKILLSGIFLLGIFCIFSSLIRLKYIIQLKQLHDNQPRYISCLPAYAPLFSKGRFLHTVIQKTAKALHLKGKKKPEKAFRPDFSISKTVAWSVRHNASMDELPKDTTRSRVEMTSIYIDSAPSTSTASYSPTNEQ